MPKLHFLCLQQSYTTGLSPDYGWKPSIHYGHLSKANENTILPPTSNQKLFYTGYWL